MTDPDTLREDLANLKSSLRNPEVAATNFAAPDTAKEKRAAEKRSKEYLAECDSQDAS